MPFGPNSEHLEKMELWNIAVPAPFYEPLTYLNAHSLPLQTGSIVNIPLGNRKLVTGVCLEKVPMQFHKGILLKEISEIAHPWVIPQNYLMWASWLSKHYVYPIGYILALLLPRIARKGKKDGQIESKTCDHWQPNLFSLNSEQREIFNKINQHRNFSVHLIQGITGSGKTEIYLHLFSEIVKAGNQGLFLVPEISLTPQMLNRFQVALGKNVGVIHSGISPKSRENTWWGLQKGEISVLMGARSALFCPIPKLGLIIIDEEHDPSFKQDTKLRYHARTAAIRLAQILNIPVVLGSATPSLESWFSAKTGKYFYYQLKSRARTSVSPQYTFVDLRKTKPITDGPFWMSAPLYDELKKVLSKGKQVALYVNRRGIAPTSICRSCGHHFECPNCDVHLVLHEKTLVCHYCGYQQTKPEHCPRCESPEIMSLGLGTKKVMQELDKLFPDIPKLRVDRDEIQNLKDLEVAIRMMEQNQIQILVGTQMIAKGLDLKELECVGVIIADQSFHLPDFRASERAGQTLFQIVGRAGRHSNDPNHPPKIVIQSFEPDRNVFKDIQAQDYDAFLERELEIRKDFFYPPFSRLVALWVENKDEIRGWQDAKRIQSWLCKTTTQDKVQILGPAKAPIGKVRGLYRFLILIKYDPRLSLGLALKTLLQHCKRRNLRSRVIADVDPQHLL